MRKQRKFAVYITAICILFAALAQYMAASAESSVSMSYGNGVLKTEGAPSGSSLYRASYEDSGRLNGVKQLEVKDEQPAEAEKGDHFFLWNGMAPLCAAVTVPDSEPQKDTLIAYFSFQGSTKKLAESIADVTDADIWRIVPEEKYGAENLNYYDPSTRSYIEQYNPSMRPSFTGEVNNISGYDTILLGYPIWYGKAPRIILTFLEAYKDELAGKTIIPFCTSGSSGISGSLSEIRSAASASTVKNGFRGTASMSAAQIRSQLSDNGYSENKK